MAAGLLTMDVDISGFDSMLFKLSRAVDAPISKIVKAESGSVLQTAMDGTKTKQRADFERAGQKQFRVYVGGVYGTRFTQHREKRIEATGQGSKKWLVDRNKAGERKFYIMEGGSPRHWSDERWNWWRNEENDRQQDMKAWITEHIGRRGLPKQSWFLLGELIDARLKAAGYVVGAKVKGNVLRSVAAALVDDLESQHVIHFTNSSRSSLYADGNAVLARAMAGRVKYFEKNLALGVFESVQKVAKAYPRLVRVY